MLGFKSLFPLSYNAIEGRCLEDEEYKDGGRGRTWFVQSWNNKGRMGKKQNGMQLPIVSEKLPNKYWP